MSFSAFFEFPRKDRVSFFWARKKCWCNNKTWHSNLPPNVNEAHYEAHKRTQKAREYNVQWFLALRWYLMYVKLKISNLLNDVLWNGETYCISYCMWELKKAQLSYVRFLPLFIIPSPLFMHYYCSLLLLFYLIITKLTLFLC